MMISLSHGFITDAYCLLQAHIVRQHVHLCASITMFVINACCLCGACVVSKNSVALFSSVQHEWTDRIVQLLKAFG